MRGGSGRDAWYCGIRSTGSGGISWILSDAQEGDPTWYLYLSFVNQSKVREFGVLEIYLVSH